MTASGLAGATTGSGSASAITDGADRRHLRRRALLSLITVHIGVSVGLLGDSAGFLAVAIRRAASTDEGFRESARELLAMFALLFGIPLSLLALLTGVTLALATRWRLFRYPWVIAKLGLILSVIVVGSTVISPVLDPRTSPQDAALIAGATWDVAALAAAVALAVFKPGRRLGRSRQRAPLPERRRPVAGRHPGNEQE